MEDVKLNFSKEIETGLNHILDFWINHAVDNTYGGFIGKMDVNDKVYPEADKGLVLNSRILWTFSAAYLQNPKPIYQKLAKRAFDYLLEYFWDKKNGGGYWSLDYKGDPKLTHKQIYGQGFMLYGFSEYYRAFDDSKALEKAIELFQIIENVAFDKKNGGYYEVASVDWKIIQDAGIITQGNAEQQKSTNTHLHIIEPYTNLYRVWKNEHLAKQIEGLLHNFSEHIIDKHTHSQHLFFSDTWEVKSSIVSFGHDIEAAWLLCEAAEELKHKELIVQFNQIALEMTEASLKGLDTDGGMFNEEDQKHLDKQKHWWPQAEAMVGFLNTYQISKNGKYFNLCLNTWAFIKKNLITSTHEWYWGLDEHNRPMINHDKIGMWKCPYHSARACMEIIKRLK